MNSLPQQVTIRYAANLLRKGSNDTFILVEVHQEAIIHDGIRLGSYYEANIRRRNYNSETASGVTPIQAITRALGKAGVTFR
jgi:hypothetical protein